MRVYLRYGFIALIFATQLCASDTTGKSGTGSSAQTYIECPAGNPNCNNPSDKSNGETLNPTQQAQENTARSNSKCPAGNANCNNPSDNLNAQNLNPAQQAQQNKAQINSSCPAGNPNCNNATEGTTNSPANAGKKTNQ